MEGAESHGKRESGTTWAFNPRLRPSSAYGRISGLGSQRRRHQVIRECSGNAIALGAQLRMLRGSILKFDRVITAWHRSHETSQRLDESPGLGPALTNALIASSLIRVRAGLMVRFLPTPLIRRDRMCPIKFGPGRRGDFNIELAEYIDDLLLSMGSLVSRTVRRIEVKDILIAGEAGVTRQSCSARNR
jgi:hypothetical protein